ncbi:DUF4185 domain-containing protein [Parapedobacter sp. 10938]|uniref:DUF4185 domain-containing protein n=1 Tax=Parapedobacter flavus TaxID=3110225 RepID=UPI002DB6EE7C|nr:DUF4185 domain-containing protein [Parapedobacter sp. 10938]MEC3879819.1 DUF4185 domain-containing protein [Parapedobacter sp. 10938]
MRLRHIKQAGVYVALGRWLCLLAACGSDGNMPTYVPTDEITASVDTLVPDKVTKNVSTTLYFDDLDGIAYVLVRKSGGDQFSRQISRSELGDAYAFTYTIQSSDPESFRLVLTAHYNDGNVSNELSLQVDNRWGFFIRRVTRIARVTGRPMSGETFASPNNTATTWNVGGTDLGVVWEMEPGAYGLFFGDTYGHDFAPNPASPGPNGGSWRSNVLAFSTDKDLADGLTLSAMATGNGGNAREIIYSAKDVSGNGDWTSIPTAAIRAAGFDYVHYFNMRSWTGWVTNYSGLYKSTDDGQTWAKCEDVTFPANSSFGQAGYFKKDGYVYMVGTQTGRDSPARLARFLEAEIENLPNYEYWDGTAGQWVQGDENRATVLIDDKVGELSFIYNETLEKWIVAYFNGDRYELTLRTADDITGPWSAPYTLASGSEYAQLYGSYIHPVSVTGNDLYFLMSMWLPYNVFLMKAELADMGEF